MRWLTVSVGLLIVSATASPLLGQVRANMPEPWTEAPNAKETPLLDSIQFAGLRHISSAAVEAQLTLHAGDNFKASKLQHDLHTLGRLGWFKTVRVEALPSPAPDDQPSAPEERWTLIFHFEEQPILSRVEYSGSLLLSRSQIEKLLEEEKLTPGLGKPADPAALHRVAMAIRSTLNELGHPEASLQVQGQAQRNNTLQVRFDIADGPHLPVRQVRFEGEPGVSEKLLSAQMQSIAPWKALASLRSKNAYTQAGFEEDRQRILAYYQDHGYPEARVGNARTERIAERSRKWFPLPRYTTRSGLLVAIPVRAGAFYHLASIEPSEALQQTIENHNGKTLFPPFIEHNHAFSQHEVDKLRRLYSLRLNSRDTKSGMASFQSVGANPIFDPETHSVRLKLNLSDSPPYAVRRIDFQGLHKFNDRFVRRRIPLREGQPLDEHALEVGLTKIARTGYFKPIHKENIHIQLDDARHTADVTIHVEEIGQQRVTFDGGRAQFGSTLGLAYTVFDLLNHEELLTAKLEGGPESLQLLLGIAKEGIFGTRGSLAFSVFDNVIRPHFTHGVQGPFTNSHSEGINAPWTYALSNYDSVGINYTLSRTVSDQTFGTPSSSSGSPPVDFRSHTSSRSVGTAWAHDTGNERAGFSDSVSGGFLGGDENMLRASGEAARIFRDPVFASKNAWAFRTIFSATGSYSGDMPFYSRLFAGDEFVRGLHTGELGPLTMTPQITPSGATTYAPSYAGANLLTATNAEYRIPLRNGVEATGFFDLGSGWLLPKWLGPTKPTLLRATNGILHGSTGFEIQWTIPGIQVPFRSYYALNDHDPANTNGVKDKRAALGLLEDGIACLSHFQEMLYAQDRWALLLIFQAMDAAGKDGVIKHVMSGVNPQGCDVHSFKSPSPEELNHDYLWRNHKSIPERGKIGIFNRSYYEEVLVVRVHPTFLRAQKLPDRLVTKHIWEERYEDINAFERYLTRNGVVIRKFFLHVSKEEQKKRFLERLEDSKKNWKFSMADVQERGFWKDYQEAYEEMIQQTATKHAPWNVVPADNKWFTRLVVASAILEALNDLNLAFPDVEKSKRKELAAVRASLLAQKD